MAARAVSGVMTAAMMVFSLLVLKGPAWMTRTGRRLAGLLPCAPAGIGQPGRFCPWWSPIVRACQAGTVGASSGSVGIVVADGPQCLVDLLGERPGGWDGRHSRRHPRSAAR
jgi:hypothetical protein